MLAFIAWSKINKKLVFGIYVIIAIVIASLFYVAINLPSFKNQTLINTPFPENKRIPVSVENKPSPTNIKENPKIVKDTSVFPVEKILIITEKDIGQYFEIKKGQQVLLRLSNNYSWIEEEPKTTGNISLVRTITDKNSVYRGGNWYIQILLPQL